MLNNQENIKTQCDCSASENGVNAALPFSRKDLIERLRDFFSNNKKYEVEYTMLKYSLYALLIILLTEVIAYFAFFRRLEVIYHYGWWVFYLNLVVISISAAMWHFKSYRGNITTMAGMMVGMTFGMQTGLMIGTIIGATNGIFVGGLTGMLSGVLVGFYNGKCCGIMGALEGVMAGMMNGVMGGMIGVMFFADKMLWFMPFFILINLFVMWGLSYMLFEEVVENNQKPRAHMRREQISFLIFLFYCLIGVFILLIIMGYAPRSGLARVI